MKLLYRMTKAKADSIVDLELDVKEYVPHPLGRWYLPGERNRKLGTTLCRIWFWLMTHGKAKIFYVCDDAGKVMHTSYVIPRCFKFPDLGTNDYTIGPCRTDSEFRGQGIYPKVLNYIVRHMGQANTAFYMVVDSENTPSIKGIEKAGFVRCGTIRKTKLFKRYYAEKEERESNE